MLTTDTPHRQPRSQAIPAKSADFSPKVARIMAYLDSKGAAFKSIEGYPGWFSAHWEDYDDYSYPQRWACSTEEGEADRPFALAFQKRAELSGLIETLH